VKRASLWLCLLLSLCLACGRERKAAPPAPVADNTPRDGGTLVRRLETDIITLNPVTASSRYDSYVAQYLFTPMIYVDRGLQPVPGLAKSWDISKDGKVYRFELNPKATFSDGTPVRASDVLFTLRKIADPASEAVQTAGSFELLDLPNTKVIDDHTIEVAFREALAMQLVRFRDVYILPEHVYSKGNFRNDYNTTVVGNGPYTLVRREANREIVLQRRKDYWGTQPHIQTVIFKIVNDHGTAWNALKRQEIDETLIASDTWLREHNDPVLNRYIDFRRFYKFNYNYIAWNGRNPVLSDKRVRRALAMCIPTDGVINDLYHGTARAMSGQFTPDSWAYNPNVPVIRYDPVGATQILASLGWTDHDGDGILDTGNDKGKGKQKLEFELLALSGSATGKQLVQMVQAEMKKVGVQVDVVVLDGATAIQRIYNGNYEAAYLSWDLDPDPDPYALFHSSQFPPRGQNFVFYSNAEADRLLDAARRELDQSKRKDLYWRLHEVLAEDQPYAWVVQASAKWGINKRVRGVDVSPGLGLFLWYPGELGWWIANAPQR
jgi:peptide/nickel transport system substrate-binding protein